MPGETPAKAVSARKASRSRVATKKDANRIAAAKAYVVAMKKAGEEVPESVKKLARMADEPGTTSRKVPTSRTVTKNAANRAAAAKAYIVAMKKAGQEVPDSVKKLAKMADETGNTPKNVPTSRVMSKREANRIAAAKVYVAAMKKAGNDVPESVRKLAQRDT
ncbi:hypothetical protein [Sinomonas humi]|uniref:Uncharacterized protein n=1 Tax=Sinomonas humi TaxID=1338436 RepID=A0A0B2ADB7_9MICC|nr:hypothetical protein [Sinomonas humi]KHL01584.1 hypothetical protein LK10_15135 [Sinomonas humi]